MKGLLFDIKDFALNDGQGIRTTVFFKGCPLRCVWCHNPEGLRPQRELYLKKSGCLDCGLCKRTCAHPECQGFGRCLHICPLNLVSVAGREWEDDALAAKLLRRKDFWVQNNGGVTFSGGEPLLQADFCLSLLQKLPGVHKAIETSGYTDEVTFRTVLSACDFVYMDLKLFDREEHIRYTGVPNDKILKNAAWLKKNGQSFCFRIPLIPGITDRAENLAAIASFVGDSPVELLPYNTLAGAKYTSVGGEYAAVLDPAASASEPCRFFQNATVRA